MQEPAHSNTAAADKWRRYSACKRGRCKPQSAVQGSPIPTQKHRGRHYLHSCGCKAAYEDGVVIGSTGTARSPRKTQAEPFRIKCDYKTRRGVGANMPSNGKRGAISKTVQRFDG